MPNTHSPRHCPFYSSGWRLEREICHHNSDFSLRDNLPRLACSAGGGKTIRTKDVGLRTLEITQIASLSPMLDLGCPSPFAVDYHAITELLGSSLASLDTPSSLAASELSMDVGQHSQTTSPANVLATSQSQTILCFPHPSKPGHIATHDPHKEEHIWTNWIVPGAERLGALPRYPPSSSQN